MVDLVLGIGAAVGASSLYSLGIALQAMDAKQAPADEHLRLALMRNLLRRARWLAGTGLSVLGWPLQVVALLLAPLVVVQPTLAAGLLVLLFLAQRMLGEHAGRHEHVMMCAIVIGVFGAALTAPNRGDHPGLRSDHHDRAGRAGGVELPSLSVPPVRSALTGDRDHARRRTGLRLERSGHEAGLG